MAIETLRPNAGGDETNLNYYDGNFEDPDPLENYKQVNEAIADDTSTYVYNVEDDTWRRDFYNIPDHSVGSGIINHITVHVRATATGDAENCLIKIAIKSGTGSGVPDTPAEGDEEAMTPDYANYSKQWTENPATTAPWTWDEIDKLQIGVNAFVYSTLGTQITQVYVEVAYTEAPEAVPRSFGFIFG